QRPEREQQGAVETPTLEDVVVVVRLAVGRELDLRSRRSAGIPVGERHDDEHDERRQHHQQDQDGHGLLTGHAGLLRGEREQQVVEHQWQCGPSASWPVVLVPIAGPWNTVLVSMVTTPPSAVMANRSRPRGAGPPFFSPTRLYCEP